MKPLSRLLPPANILVGCLARDKAAALDLVAAMFAASGALDEEEVRLCLREREALGSTGLGVGVAIPHGRLRGLKQAVAALVRLAEPVAFDAPDGRPVGLLVALLVPEQAQQAHLDLLAQLAQLLSDRELRAGLCAATTTAGVLARLRAWEDLRAAA